MWGQILLVGVIVFVMSGLFVSGITSAFRSRSIERSEFLARRLGTRLGTAEVQALRLQLRQEAGEGLGRLGFYLADLIEQAGSAITLRHFVFQSLGFAMGGALTLLIVTRNPVGVVGLAIGFFPLLRLQQQAEKRALMVSQQLPQALDIIGRSMLAGHGLSDAFRLCAEEMPQPIASELGRVYEEHNLGRDFRECMVNLVSRNPHNFDLRIFTSSVLLQRETGGNLVEILSNIANTIRGRFTFQGKIRALTSEARLSGYILGSLPIFVALAIAFVRGTYLLPLVNDPIGRLMLAYGVVSFGVGAYVMKRLARLDV